MKGCKLKAAISVVLAGYLLMGTVFAAGGTIKGGQVSAAAGGETDFCVSIENNSGLAAYMVYLQWDTPLITAAKNGDSYAVTKGDFTSAGTVMSNGHGANGLTVLWFNATNVKTAGGALFTVKLNIDAGLKAGKYPVHVSISEADTIDEDGKPVPLQTVDGSVTVISSGSDDTGGKDAPADTSGVTPGGNNSDSTQPSKQPDAQDQKPADNGKKTFSDVPADNWAYEYISAMAQKGIVGGFADGSFHPSENVTRAQFVKMLGEIMGIDVKQYTSCKYNDVPKDAWFMPYVAWADQNGVVTGTGEGVFSPNAPITREQIAAIIYRCAQHFGIILPETMEAVDFADAAQISPYAAAAVKCVQQAGIISGYGDSSFRPKADATRAEAAKMLYGFMTAVG